MKKILIGIDVSKEKLDLCLLHEHDMSQEVVIANQLTVICTYLNEVVDTYECSYSDILICAEYTGQYTYPLSFACEELGIDLWLENPVEIKYRSGMQRGKNDKIDAHRIALYAQHYQEKARLFSLPEKHVAALKQLLSERDMYVCDKGKYQGQLTDQERFMDKKDYENKKKRLIGLIDGLEQSICAIDQDIQELIDTDDTLSNQHRLLCSIDGIGERTALKMIVETNAFKDFTDPRKFCCHAGVAPFSYTSGSSRHSRNKVSSRADKSIKTLLHMAALVSATRMKGEINEYYVRKVNEGKNKMSVLNAVRAKLVYRMFAVIKNNKMYEKNYSFSIA